MGKFYGKVGFVTSQETSPGVWEEIATEKECYGEIARDIRRWNGTSERLNDDVSIDGQINILGDPYTFKNFSFIRFVEYMGVPWKVISVESQYPRIILHTGGVYNGVRGQETGTSSDSM